VRDVGRVVAHQRVVRLEEGDFEIVDLGDCASNVFVSRARRDVDTSFDPAAAAFAAAALAGAALAGAVALARAALAFVPAKAWKR
jgi:hypothetical protein